MITNSNRPRVSMGFTIIELMLAIAVFAVVTTVAIPSFNSFIERNQLTTSINNFAAALAVARSEAIKRKQSVSVCTSDDQEVCSPQPGYENGWIVVVDSTGEVVWANENLPGAYTLRGNGGFASNVRYRPDGRPSGLGGSITLCKNGDAGKARKLVISNTGRVRLEESQSIQTSDCGVVS